MIIKTQKGQHIHSLDEWFVFAPPAKRELHWKDGRSAKELAKAWIPPNGPEMPQVLSDLLSTHPNTAGFQAEWAIPEYETKLDDFKGKGRTHDLIVMGHANGNKILIAIEAKLDESFGELVNRKRVNKNERSKAPVRVKQLSAAILGSTDAGLIRYQLIHAVAGTLIEAKNRNADLAVLIIHEFVPIHGKSKQAIDNKHDLDNFIQHMSNQSHSNISVELIGPLQTPGGGYIPSDLPLFIGKLESPIKEMNEVYLKGGSQLE